MSVKLHSYLLEKKKKRNKYVMNLSDKLNLKTKQRVTSKANLRKPRQEATNIRN